jgi:hypothetical protein
MDLAQALWDEAQNDPSYAAVLRSQVSQLAKDMASGRVTGDIVSGSKNGSSYTMRPGMTIGVRLSAMRYVLKCLETNTPPSRTSRILFTTPPKYEP